jgi:hypothetical protein
MSSSRLENQAMDGRGQTTSLGEYCIKGVKYFLAGIKTVTSGALTFFGFQRSFSYSVENENIFSTPNVITSALFATNSLISVGGTRSREMILSSQPKRLDRSLPQSELIVDTASHERSCHCFIPPELANLDITHKAIYALIIFLSKVSRFFSSLAAYNGAINLLETIVALITSSDAPLAEINDDPLKQALIQFFGLICFSAQMLSFSMFQSTALKDYLLNWWFNTEKRNKQVNSQGYLNILLAINFFIVIASATFFGVFSTEAGLRNLNETLFKSILGFVIPQAVIDSMVGISSVSLVSLISTSVIPATYLFLTNKDQPGRGRSLTTTGNILMVSGMLDCLASSYSTTYSSIIRMSKLFNIDKYNLFLRMATILSIGSTSFFYYFVYSTRPSLERFYLANDNLENLNERLISSEIKITVETDQDQLVSYATKKSAFASGGPGFYSMPVEVKDRAFIHNNIQISSDDNRPLSP